MAGVPAPGLRSRGKAWRNMSEPRDTKGAEETICRRCSGSACARTTRRQFMIAGGASAITVGALGLVRPAWSEEPKPLLAPVAQPIKKCLLRVAWVGKEGAAGEAESLTTALAGTARKLDVDLDAGAPAAGAPDGLLVVALNGKRDEAMAEAAKGGATPAVVLCPGGQGPSSGAVWQLGQSKAGLLVGASKEEKDVTYGLRMLHAAWKLRGNARTFRRWFRANHRRNIATPPLLPRLGPKVPPRASSKAPVAPVVVGPMLREGDGNGTESGLKGPEFGTEQKPDRKEIVMKTIERLAVVCLLAVCWAGRTAAAEDAASAARPAKRPLILIQVPAWPGDDHNWGGPYDGPTSKRICDKILKSEAARLGVELTSDAGKIKECDGALSVNPQSPPADVPFVDVVFQGHRGFYDAFHKSWDLKRKRYLLASTNDPQWLRTGLRLLKAAWQVSNARVCVVTDEAGAADSVHPQLGTTFHPVPSARLDEEIRKVNDQEAVAVDYMHQGRMDGTVEGTSGYQKMEAEKWYVVDPALAEKAKQQTIAVARFYLGCRNLLTAENPPRPLAGEGQGVRADRFMATYFTCPTRLTGYEDEPPASFSIGPGAEAKGFGIQTRWRKGEQITRLQLKCSKVLMARGKVCYSDIRVKDGHRTAVAIELENQTGGPATDAPNCVIVYGDCANEMCCLARLMDLDFPAMAGVLVPR